MKGFDPAFEDPTDYILGITREIWEDRGIDTLHRYYAPEIGVRSPDGVVVGNTGVIAATMATLAEFPDRELLGEDVIWSDDGQGGFLSSHRILSMATHAGHGAFGPPSGTRFVYRIIADCAARENQIYDEWLIRDLGAIVRQLGADPERFAAEQIQAEGGPEAARRPFTPADDVPPVYTGTGNDDEPGATMGPLQRRPDVFMAGANDVDDGATTWVCTMGHLMGLFDRPWLGIPPTGRMCFLRFAEFHRVDEGRIAETALFCDVIAVMVQAGCNPLPPPTGAHIVHPGPLTHYGLLYDRQDPVAGVETMALVNRMVADLSELNRTGDDRCSPDVLARTWREDMIWYGPAGIGATYTIDRYQQQHQYPFREGLTDKVFNGHVARFAEGDYAGFFGWSNLTNTPTGGFLGLPASDRRADMRVVDIYRRQGDRLAENWVFIDLLHWLSMQGLDVLGRLGSLGPPPAPTGERPPSQPTEDRP